MRLVAIALVGLTIVALCEEYAYASSKKEIQQVQTQLQALGYEPGTADGAMGQKTVAALKKFQADHSLTATGEIDNKTLDALRSAAGIRSEPRQLATEPQGRDGTVEGRLLIEAALVMQSTGSPGYVFLLVSESGTRYVISLDALATATLPASWHPAGDPHVVQPPNCKAISDIEIELCGRYSVQGTIFGPTSVSLSFGSLSHGQAGKIIPVTKIDDLAPPAAPK